MLAANRTKEAIRSLGWERVRGTDRGPLSACLDSASAARPGPVRTAAWTFESASRAGETYLVQCKQWRTRRVGVKVVRELFGVVAAEDATGGIVVTAGTFTREAVEFAGRVAVELIDGDRLQDMMRDLPVQRADGADRGDDKAVEATLCPRCGSDLVLRTARRGAKQGSKFYGCSSYPRCRFTRPC